MLTDNGARYGKKKNISNRGNESWEEEEEEGRRERWRREGIKKKKKKEKSEESQLVCIPVFVPR